MFVLRQVDDRRYVGYDASGEALLTSRVIDAARFKSRDEASEFLAHNETFAEMRVAVVGWHGHEDVFGGVHFQIMRSKMGWRSRIVTRYRDGVPIYRSLKRNLESPEAAIAYARLYIKTHILQSI